MKKDFSYCAQVHQIDLCSSCKRNFKLLKEKKLNDIVEMTVFTPKLIPKPSCSGYMKR